MRTKLDLGKSRPFSPALELEVSLSFGVSPQRFELITEVQVDQDTESPLWDEDLSSVRAMEMMSFVRDFI